MAHYFLLKEPATNEATAIGIGFVAIPRMIPPHRYEPKVIAQRQQRVIKLDQREFVSTPVFMPQAGIAVKYAEKTKFEFKLPFPKTQHTVVIVLANTNREAMVINGRRLTNNQWLEVTPDQLIDLNGRKALILGHEDLLQNFLGRVLGIDYPDEVRKGIFFGTLLHSFYAVIMEEGLCQSIQAVHHQYQVEYTTSLVSAEAGLLIHLIKSSLYKAANYLLISGHPQAGAVLGLINSRRQDMPFGMTGNPIKELTTEAAHHTRNARLILSKGKDIDELRAMPKKIDFVEVVRILKRSLALAKNLKSWRTRG